MAAPVVARSSGPPLCPSFAEVCSFLERYGTALDLPEMTFPQMERYLRDTTAVPKPLVELHVKLLRKLGRSVTTDRWEKYLAKVCQELNSTWAWELEQKGYQEMSMECKSSILKYLCECQFDDNLKFKMVVNDEDPEKMRLQPIGRDQQGLMYWLQLDQEQNIRLYTEEQDDLDGSTWKCIVKTRNDLAEALELLKAQIESNQCQDQDQNQNQAGSHSTSPAEKDTANEDFGVKNTNPPKTFAEQTDKKANPVTEKKQIKQVIKEEEEIKQENTESKMEEKMDRKLAAFDNRVSTITAIKSEHRDPDGPKNAVSVLISPSVSLIKMNPEDEAKRTAVRCNQQAKIPLKKRDLKLAGCFHTNHLNNTNSSSIIVCNPSLVNSKDCRGRDGKVLNSLAPQGSPGSSLQQQQPVVIVSRQELTNGGASHLPPREGHNGVIGQVGVVSHVGVIRSPPELHRALGAEHREENGPMSEPSGLRAAEEGNEVSRQSVLVKKRQPDQETTPAPSTLPLHATPPFTSLKMEVIERKVESVSFSSLNTTETSRQMGEDQNTKTTEKMDEGRTTDHNSGQQEEGDPEESRKESSGVISPQKADKLNKKDQQGQGVNGGLVSVVKLKKIGFVSEQKRLPLEEASSELQKEGIRLKIKIPPHRRNKLRRKEGKEEIKNREQEVEKDGRPLRRSARICRSSALPNCRPSSKVTESQRKKSQKQETPPASMREGEEADEEEDDEEQSSPLTKNQKQEPSGKFSKRRGKRRHGRPRWTNVRPKRHKPNEEGDEEDKGKKRGEEEEKEGSASEEELCKSKEIPAEDACTHCGLPNHPELILLCDLCDRGYHTACLRPPLMLIPDGEWFCPPCQHKMLCEKLEEQLQNLDSALKKKERAERRRERLVYVGISVENIIPEGDGEEGGEEEEEEEEEEKSAKKKDPKKTKTLGRRSTRTRKHISYRFDDFDDAIDEAIEEDFRDLCSGAETGKEIPTVLSEVVKENQRPIRSQTRAVRNKKKRRLNDLESDSTAIESEEEFMLSNSSEEEEFGASGGDDDEEDAGSEGGGSWDKGARPKRGLRGVPKYKPRRAQRRGRKRRRRRSSEEESDIGMDSDRFSDMTDSDTDKKRRGLRRGQRQQVNYRETSESSDNSRTSTKKEQVKRRGRPRKEHFSSDYSDVSAYSRDSEEDDDYDEEEADGRRRVDRRRRRREEAEVRSSRTKERRRRYKEEGRMRLKTRQLGKDDVGRRSSARTDREEEDPERMGRGKRREILLQQRRRRLAQMLKKRRPSTDDEDESESDDSQSSSGDDRPIRKRLNRIDSDDEEDEKHSDSDDEADEDKGQKIISKRSSGAVQRADNKNDGGAQEKGRGRSLSPSNRHQTCRDPPKPGTGSPAVRRDSAGSGRQESHNGPMHLSGEDEDEEGQSDSLNSVQNSPKS
ncbi:remodeling and spacing factor 1 isoform X1 [Girardinichthys multiradiatus]|uniref:remodeling and spacing factor 1 isoform X1 n=1 Tax=Girardinichthys multiradiatus TaxID=208333 RepID=UPI001FAD6AEC|nr:remodeling and spacing factor 1 isoform X1 [Girardinichthys multiradiatus]